MQSQQESVYRAGHDYRNGSPHLQHWRLHDRLVGLVVEAARDLRARGLPPTALEIGAGHGGFTEPILASGYAVTATEMSRPSLHVLRERFGINPGFQAIFDPDGSLDTVGEQHFALLVGASVLHHIPDYLAVLSRAIERHLLPGGNVVILQDPLWYPSLGRASLLASKAAYLTWRLSQGNYLRGLRTRIRRARGVYRDFELSDTVEYHVVRQGVDHHALVAALEQRFAEVHLLPYWSTQAAALQRAGELAGLQNTFAISARNFVV